MDRFHQHSLRAAVAAIAASFTICAAAAGRVEQVATQTEFSPPAADPGASVDIEAAFARVKAARSRAEADPRALEDALTALGDAFLNASQYASAQANYSEAVQLAEQHGGLETERVLAPLLGLGNTLARSRRHEDAVPRLQRALVIQRAQYGMFDLRQEDTLKTLAASLTALNRVPEAQDLLLYRLRAAEKTYGEGSPKLVPALCDLGNWFAEVGKTPEARLTFQMALNIVGDKPSLMAPIVVEPLRGTARAHMLRSSYPEGWLVPPSPPGCIAPGPPVQGCPARHTPDGELIVGTRELNREGEDMLKRALRIVEADPDASAQTRIETLLQMGDWYQIKKAPREALPYYQRAWQLSRTASRSPGSAATALDVPLRVYYPTPQIVAHVPTVPPAETRSHHVQLEFAVAADGSVADARIVEHDTRDRYARDILDAVRASRFRPKFVDGHAVATRGVTYSEVFWTAQSRD